MLAWTVQNYLRSHQIPFEPINHATARTALQVARRAHVPKNKLAKTIVVNVDGQMTMVVVHADERIDLSQLREFLEAEAVELAPEGELREYFPDCEVGAIPPLGDVYQMPVVVSESVSLEDTITFSAGTHTGVITLPYLYFSAINRPLVGRFVTGRRELSSN